MNFSGGNIVEHYEALISEYRADLERNIELAAGSASTPAPAIDGINRLLVSEIARLKVQMIDMDIRLARLLGGSGGTGLTPFFENMWASMPVYDAGGFISITAGVTTHGFHPAEASSAGRGHRWSGPSTRSGFVAVINRAKSLVAEAVVIKIIDPKIKFLQVTVDGEAMSFEWSSPGRLRFMLPSLPAVEPVPTQISFLTSECVVIADAQPQYNDQRKVSFSMSGIQLLGFDEAR